MMIKNAHHPSSSQDATDLVIKCLSSFKKYYQKRFSLANSSFSMSIHLSLFCFKKIIFHFYFILCLSSNFNFFMLSRVILIFWQTSGVEVRFFRRLEHSVSVWFKGPGIILFRRSLMVDNDLT